MTSTPVAARQFLRDIVTVFIANSVVNLKTLIIIPLITKQMGALNYGLWAQATVTINVFVPVITLGLHAALTRFLTSEPDRTRLRGDLYALLTTVAATGIAAGVLVLAFARPIAAVFFAGNVHVVQLVALALPIHNLEILLYAHLRAMRRMKTYAAVLIAEPLLHIVAVVLITRSGGSIELVLLTHIAFKLLAILVMLVLVLVERKPAWPGWSRMREFLAYGLPYVPAGIFYWLMSQSDRFIIGLFLGVALVGCYAPAYSMGVAITYFALPVEFALFPIVAQLYDAEDYEQVRNYLRLALRLFLVAALPSLVGLTILARPLLTLFTTSQISRQGALVVPFVALGATIYGVNLIFAEIIGLIKRTRIAAVATASAAAVSVAGNLLLVPRYGIVAAGILFGVATTIQAVVIGTYGLRRFPVAMEWGRLARLAGATLLIVPVLLWPLLTGRHLVPALVAAALVYAGGVLGFGVLRPRELRMLFGVLPGART